MLWAALALLPDPTLDEAAKAAVADVRQTLSFSEEAVAIGLALVESDGTVRSGGYRHREAMYPASVVKLFYLAHLEHLVAKGKVRRNPELDRAEEDMIRESSNDATSLVLDTLSGTTGGPSLAPRELARWIERRQATNRWFATLGITGINACQKTWNEGPYGRERQGYGPNFERRNSLHPEACVQLLTLIAQDRLPNAARMLALLSRPNPQDGSSDYQGTHFIGAALPKGARLWSKAGYVNQERHDVALVQFPNGERVVLAIFTRAYDQSPNLVTRLAARLFARLNLPYHEPT